MLLHQLYLKLHSVVWALELFYLLSFPIQYEKSSIVEPISSDAPINFNQNWYIGADFHVASFLR